jgi:hypothetical protein
VAERERYVLDDLSAAAVGRPTLMSLRRRRATAQNLADIEALELLERLDE